MKAIILNAGQDKVFETILEGKPKCLLEIDGSTLLEIQVNTLYKCGIEDVTVVRGYGKQYIDIPGIKYYDNDQYNETGTLYSLMQAEEQMDEDICILYGDIVFHDEVIKKILSNPKDIVVGTIVNYKDTLGNDTNYKDKEMMIIDADNKVSVIGKQIDQEKHSALFGGVVKVSKKGIKTLINNYKRVLQVDQCNDFLDKKKLYSAWLVDFINEMAVLGVDIHTSLIEEQWVEIDTLEDYKKILENNTFLSNVLSVKTDWNDRSQTYNNIKWVNSNETLDLMVELAGDLNNKRILDLGTGTGKVLKYFYDSESNAEYNGLDISLGMMSKIDKKLPFKLWEGKIENLYMFEDDSVDIVTARMVLHHGNDLEKTFQEVKRVLKKGGKFIVCEGTPPSKECLKFYEEMFRYKEERHTFLIDDLMNLYANAGFENITGKVSVLPNMSLNNWLENAGVPYRNIDIIRRMHYDSEKKVKQAYDMKEVGNDLLMTWKFAVLYGEK